MLDMIYSDARSIQSLPNDNRWILTYCLSDTPLDTCFPKYFPWYLGHICRSWRSVFISSPRFWDRFIIDASVAAAFKAERALTLVELCIKRTKDQPFSFRFNELIFDLKVTSYMCQAMKTLVAHADRWSAASVKIKGFGGVEELLLKAKHRFRQLHTLYISIFPGISHHLDLFEDAPNLTRVYTTDHYRLRWSSLTVLHISSHTFVKLYEQFDKMTCLQELVIRGTPLQRERVLQTPVEIPSLKILYVKHYYPLSFIRAPSLETLHLGDILPVLRRTAVETFVRGVSHLRTLSFNVNVCTVLDCIPELDHAIVGISMLPALVYMARSLKTITISDPDLYERERERGTKTLGTITSMVQRWEKHQLPNLRRLSVHVYDDGEEDMSPAIDDLVRLGAYKGFEVDIKFSPFHIVPPFRDL
ncbi:hypothetical protein F5887DRAFT_1003976 [Amanita rubescens]|nr:hypothetical protein F5887DRAFT_1003976 [Amanita rubescens]